MDILGWCCRLFPLLLACDTLPTVTTTLVVGVVFSLKALAPVEYIGMSRRQLKSIMCDLGSGLWVICECVGEIVALIDSFPSTFRLPFLSSFISWLPPR